MHSVVSAEAQSNVPEGDSQKIPNLQSKSQHGNTTIQAALLEGLLRAQDGFSWVSTLPLLPMLIDLRGLGFRV